MWASVPHRDAARTRIRTSAGPHAGTSMSAHSSAPGRGATLRIAFISTCHAWGGIHRAKDGWSTSGTRIITAGLRGRQPEGGSLKSPGQLQAVVSPVLLDGVLDVVLRAGVRVGRVEQVVHARRKIQPSGQVPAQERQVDDRAPGGIVSGQRQTRAGVLRLDSTR